MKRRDKDNWGIMGVISWAGFSELSLFFLVKLPERNNFVWGQKSFKKLTEKCVPIFTPEGYQLGEVTGVGFDLGKGERSVN